jgi:hypothetical protein
MDRRPLDVALIAIYFAAFSSVLVWLIVYQLLAHRIHMPWQDKIVLLPFTLLIAIIPATIALGLWVMDIAARLAAIILAVIHAGTEVALLSHPLIPSRPFTVFRIVLDGVIIICLCRPGVRKAFQWQPVGFSLRGNRTF